MGFCNSISSVAPDDPNDEPTVRSKPKKRGWGLKKKESGRLEGHPPSDDKAPSRDGLHSAPSGDAAAKQEKLTSPSKLTNRAGLHSAPPDRKSAPAVASEAPLPKPALGEFLVEGVGGVSATDADVYCTNILGTPLHYLNCVYCLGCCLCYHLGLARHTRHTPLSPHAGPALVKELRAPEWAARVRGLEAMQALINSRLGCECVGLAAAGCAEQLALFKAGVTVLARLVQDKVVPVYLPALQLLDELFAPSTASGLPASLLRGALDILAPQLVTRAGSSNVRAREDSTKVLLRLAHSPHVGGVVVGLHTLRPLPNSKSQHAALGRLELLAESRTSSRHSSPPLLPGAGTVSSARLLSGPTRRKVHLGRSCGFR
jgi:hypothetical protein